MAKDSNIFDPTTGCILHEVMLDYLRGALPGRERNLVERHLAGCEMCSDELEGLSYLGNPGTIASIEAELNVRIDRRMAPTIDWFAPSVLLRIAASVVVLVGVSVLVYFIAFRSAPAILITESTPTPEQGASAPDSMRGVEEALTGKGYLAEGTAQRKFEAKRQKDPQSPSGAVADSAGKKSIRGYDAPAPQAAIDRVDDAVFTDLLVEGEADSAVGASLAISEAAAKDEQHKEQEGVTGREKTAAAKTVGVIALGERVSSFNPGLGTTDENKLVGKAIGLYQGEQYSQALALFTQLAGKTTATDTVLFYQSMCHYQTGSYAQAAQGLKPFLQKTGSQFYFKAQWYYALSLIELGLKEEADVVLQSIIGSNSPFKEEAKKLSLNI